MMKGESKYNLTDLSSTGSISGEDLNHNTGSDTIYDKPPPHPPPTLVDQDLDPSLDQSLEQTQDHTLIKLNGHESDTKSNGHLNGSSVVSLTDEEISAPSDSVSGLCSPKSWRYCPDLWPPRKKVAFYLIIALVCLFLWGILWSITRRDAVPGGHLFSLVMLVAACWAFGEMLSKFRMPALLGMLVMGFVLRNIPHLDLAQELREDWSSVLRNAALAIILTRAGMGLDPDKLKKMSGVCLRLACIPCIAEGLAAGAAAYWLLGYTLMGGFTLGFVLAGLSPAVVVPPMLWLQEQGLGVEKGIPTLGVFTAGVDDALAVAVFGIFLSVSFSSNALWFTIIQGPLEIMIGVAYGVALGVITWYLPNKTSKSVVFPRFALLFSGSLFAIYISQHIDFAGAGAVGSLIFAFVAAYGWRKDNNGDKAVSRVYSIVWTVMQPVLFGLIGAEIAVESLTGEIVGYGIAVIFIGLAARTVIGVLCVTRSGFNWKEILFIQFMCLPKATVQAAIGPLVLDAARKQHAGEAAEIMGFQTLMIAAISILVCAPLGGISMAVSAKRLLKKASPENMTEADFEAE